MKLFSRACDAGEGASCNELGFFAQKGRVLPQSGTTAMDYWRRACALGSARGCDSLGTGWQEGTGGAVDLAAAVAAWEAACRQHVPAGCTNLGLALMQGRGVERDPARAEALWRQSCAGEDIDASCRLLARALVDGNGVARDVRAGLATFRHACERGWAEDCFAASEAIREFGDAVEARRYLRTSCKWGLPRGCLLLARELEEDARAESLEEAIEVRELACKQGAHEACPPDAGSPP